MTPQLLAGLLSVLVIYVAVYWVLPWCASLIVLAKLHSLRDEIYALAIEDKFFGDSQLFRAADRAFGAAIHCARDRAPMDAFRLLGREFAKASPEHVQAAQALSEGQSAKVLEVLEHALAWRLWCLILSGAFRYSGLIMVGIGVLLGVVALVSMLAWYAWRLQRWGRTLTTRLIGGVELFALPPNYSLAYA